MLFFYPRYIFRLTESDITGKGYPLIRHPTGDTFSSPEAAPPLSFGHSPNGGTPRGRLFGDI